MRRIITAAVAALFLLSGCSLPFSKSVEPTAVTQLEIGLTQNSNLAVTPTPFLPIPPTSTPVPTATLTPQPTATSSAALNLGLPRPEGQINILLLGSDKRQSSGFRTDVIMLLSLNPQKGTATLTSFPRDLYVDIPGIGYERINTTQEYGGFDLTKATFLNNFEIPVDYYIMTSFTGFKAIIDTLSGITVVAASSLKDTCDLPQEVDGYCSISAGENSMDGATALWYARSRKSTSDFDRTRRAQEVILAIFRKLMTLDAVNNSSEIYNLFINNVETNIPLSTVVEIIPLAVQIYADTSIVERYAIGASNTSSYIVPATGASVLLPDKNSIREIIREAVFQ